MDSFVDGLNIPSVGGLLDYPITQDEINLAIKCMQSGKSPGLDGFPTEFYQYIN